MMSFIYWYPLNENGNASEDANLSLLCELPF